MARHGLKRPREGGPADGERILCPFEGCPFSATTDRAVAIHISRVEHFTALRSASSSESHGSEESFSSDSSVSSPSECSSSHECASASSSDPVSGYGCFSAAGDVSSQDQGLLHDQVSGLSDALDEGHSDARSSASAMNIDLGDAVACEPDPSHADSGSSSSNSSSSSSSNDGDQQDDSSANPAGLHHAGGNGQASKLTEQELRLHDVLNGLPLQKQQQVMDYLRDPTFDPSQVRFTTARGLRKTEKAICKQVSMTTVMHL